jgi:hypothetical protein
MLIIATSPHDRAQQLLALTERLNERLLFELEALKSNRPRDIYDHVEETRNLSALYRQETQRLKADKSLLDGIGEAEKAALRKATLSFMKTTEAHAHAVEAAKSISEGLLKAIADQVANTHKPQMTYGPKTKPNHQPPQSLGGGYRI